MKITQISVFLENKQGRLHEAASALGARGVNIRALNIAETADYGVLRMVVDKPAEALAALKERGMVASQTDVVVVEVPDRPGGLARVLDIFKNAGINVEYMYGFFERKADRAMLVFRVDRPEPAIAALAAQDVKVISDAGAPS